MGTAHKKNSLGFGLLFMILVFTPIRQPNEFWTRFWEMFWSNSGYWYFVFAIMAGYLFWSFSKTKEMFYKHRLNFKAEIWALLMPVPLTLLYLTVLTFAYHIYPYIPAERGGGDYTAEKASILTFNAQFSNSIPTEIFGASHTNLQSQKAVILDETANTIFIAIPTNGIDEIAAWRQNLPITTNHPNSRPQKIFAIQREAVVSERSESWK